MRLLNEITGRYRPPRMNRQEQLFYQGLSIVNALMIGILVVWAIYVCL